MTTSSHIDMEKRLKVLEFIGKRGIVGAIDLQDEFGYTAGGAQKMFTFLKHPGAHSGKSDTVET